MDEKELVTRYLNITGDMLVEKFYSEIESEIEMFTDIDFMDYTTAVMISIMYGIVDKEHHYKIDIHKDNLKTLYDNFSGIHTSKSDQLISIWCKLLSQRNKYVIRFIDAMRKLGLKCEIGVDSNIISNFYLEIKLDI